MATSGFIAALMALNLLFSNSFTLLMPHRAVQSRLTVRYMSTANNDISAFNGTSEPSLSSKNLLLGLEDLDDALLDLEYIQKTIDEWKRPLPSEYLTRPLVLVGPSAVGKARLVKLLLKDYTKYFKKVVTHTTRQPRDDEKDGVHYHFVSDATYDDMMADGLFLEHAAVHDHRYGISFQAWHHASSAHKIKIIEVDVQGAAFMRRLCCQREKEAAAAHSKSMNGELVESGEDELRRALLQIGQIKPYFVFISPPTVDILRARLVERGAETNAQVLEPADPQPHPPPSTLTLTLTLTLDVCT